MTNKQKALSRNPELKVLKKDPYSHWVSLPSLPVGVRIHGWSGWWYKFVKKRIMSPSSTIRFAHYHRPARHKRRKQWHWIIYYPPESRAYLRVLGQGRSEVEAWKDYNKHYDAYKGQGQYKKKNTHSLRKTTS